ncbi:MAG: molecular chaperone HtpG [Saprospiraceae bacterium]|nr:molecular chaperone HtpG [Saprospiraceae bacterium]
MITGNISVQTENIFPIIKKFLYSDQEIFLRELVSNAVDATTKLQTLAKRGEVAGEIGDTHVEVIIDKEAKTLTIRDRGIGLTADEAQRYLSEVAFSSAAEFLEKYKEGNIIGHFGLGFYSAFMVASQVEVVSKSYKPNAKAVRWTCDGTPQYTIEEIEKAERGTDIILHVTAEDEQDYLDDAKIEGLLEKYCKFLPVDIQFGTKKEKPEGAETEIEVPNIVNNSAPIWKKSPNELSDDDYRNFYNEIYPLSTPPLFWIHLNIDYPFNLTGILYFPKISNALEAQKNKVQLYCNQVFVTDDVKEILPEFLTLLHGVIDSPDIPLNVSRSYLQSDREVKKITQYITKKVGDKLSELFRKDRAEYENKWKDISVFVKYGMLSDEKFDEKAREFVLLKNTEGSLFTLEEYREKVKPAQTDKNDRLVYIYSNNVDAHDAQIQAAKGRGYDVLEMDTVIDNHFMQHLEYKGDKVSFVRVDSETVDNLVPKDHKIESVLSEDQQKSVKSVFEKFIGIDDFNNRIELKALSPEDAPVQITRNEFMRRMSEMRQFSTMDMGSMPDSKTIVVNTNHPLVSDKLLTINDETKQNEFAQYLYDLARVSQGLLTGAELTAFVKRSLAFIK